MKEGYMDKKAFVGAGVRAIFLTFFLSLLWLWITAPAMAESVEEDVEWEPMTMSQVSHGTLLLKGEQPGLYRVARGVETDVSIKVSGFIARTVVRQRFANPDEAWREGIYVFPLPSGSAVDAMRLVIGERLIEGEIQERSQAKRTYEAAKRSGQKASLVEQERPNLFTTSVANIGPNEEVDVVIEFQEDLRYDSGAFRLRFPMVVNPRYSPRSSNSELLSSTDAGRLSSPSAGRDSAHRLWNPVNLGIEIDAGMPLANVQSPSHNIRVDLIEPGRYRVEPSAGLVPADRDFVLEWRPELGDQPRTAVFLEEHDGAEYLLLMVMPPDRELGESRIARETIFVLDRSGSMSGAPMQQAKQALLNALDRLPPDDHFNIILFSSDSSRLFEQSVPATSTYRDVAKRRIESLSADGGTEMMGALRLAFEDQALEDQATDLGVRQVIFVTDGSVSNEEALFAYIRNHLGRSRLFTVGIGSAPNGHFMRKAANFGRGTFTFIGDPREVANKMGELFAKIEHPVLRDLEVHWQDPSTETWPQRPGDLYAGEPLVLAARSESGFDDLLLEGWMGNAPWTEHLIPQVGEDRQGIHKLWARKKISALMDRITGGADAETIRHEVVSLGLDHHLVTKFTSLVAVDKTPSRPEHETLHSDKVAVNRPAGVLPQGGTHSRLERLAGLLLMLTAGLWRELQSVRAGRRADSMGSMGQALGRNRPWWRKR